jgi:multidrug resistance efflux pump
MKVDAQAHATLLRHFEQLKHTVDQVVVKVRQNGQLKAFKRLFLRMSRLEASGTVTPSQREDAREEYKALFAQLKKL